MTTGSSVRTMSVQGKMYYTQSSAAPLAMPLTRCPHSASASLSPNGSLLAVSNLVTGFDVYRTDTEQPIASFEQPIQKPNVVPVLFIHGGRAIVGGCDSGTVNVWDIALGKLHSLSIPSTLQLVDPCVT